MLGYIIFSIHTDSLCILLCQALALTPCSIIPSLFAGFHISLKHIFHHMVFFVGLLLQVFLCLRISKLFHQTSFHTKMFRLPNKYQLFLPIPPKPYSFLGSKYRPLKPLDFFYQTMNHEFSSICLKDSQLFEQDHHDFVEANA